MELGREHHNAQGARGEGAAEAGCGGSQQLLGEGGGAGRAGCGGAGAGAALGCQGVHGSSGVEAGRGCQHQAPQAILQDEVAASQEHLAWGRAGEAGRVRWQGRAAPVLVPVPRGHKGQPAAPHAVPLHSSSSSRGDCIHPAGEAAPARQCHSHLHPVVLQRALCALLIQALKLIQASHGGPSWDGIHLPTHLAGGSHNAQRCSWGREHQVGVGGVAQQVAVTPGQHPWGHQVNAVPRKLLSQHAMVVLPPQQGAIHKEVGGGTRSHEKDYFQSFPITI